MNGVPTLMAMVMTMRVMKLMIGNSISVQFLALRIMTQHILMVQKPQRKWDSLSKTRWNLMT